MLQERAPSCVHGVYFENHSLFIFARTLSWASSRDSNVVPIGWKFPRARRVSEFKHRSEPGWGPPMVCQFEVLFFVQRGWANEEGVSVGKWNIFKTANQRREAWTEPRICQKRRTNGLNGLTGVRASVRVFSATSEKNQQLLRFQPEILTEWVIVVTVRETKALTLLFCTARNWRTPTPTTFGVCTRDKRYKSALV